jgi:hypothetical protein
MRTTFLPQLQRDPVADNGGNIWTPGAVKTADQLSAETNGGGSIWTTIAANAGSSLAGVASLINALNGQNTTPTVNQYYGSGGGGGTSGMGGSWLWIGGAVVGLILVLFLLSKK